MRQLLETAGFIVTATGSWGNRECLFADLKPGLGWTMYDSRRHNFTTSPISDCDMGLRAEAGSELES